MLTNKVHTEHSQEKNTKKLKKNTIIDKTETSINENKIYRKFSGTHCENKHRALSD